MNKKSETVEVQRWSSRKWLASLQSKEVEVSEVVFAEGKVRRAIVCIGTLIDFDDWSFLIQDKSGEKWLVLKGGGLLVREVAL